MKQGKSKAISKQGRKNSGKAGLLPAPLQNQQE